MIQRLEVAGLRALRHVCVDLSGFHLLVGANATGKSTFFEGLHLLRDILRSGIDSAVHGSLSEGVNQRAEDPKDLTWMRKGNLIEIVVTATIPDRLRREQSHSYCRYEMALAVEPRLEIRNETFWLCQEYPDRPVQSGLFPDQESITRQPGTKSPTGWRKVVSKISESGNDYFQSETTKWNNQFRLGPAKSALANLPEDTDKFPVAIWFKQFLMEGVYRLALNAEKMRLPSPPGTPQGFFPDGSNLPWCIHDLEANDPDRLDEWVQHLRTALPGLKSVSTREREENRARYTVVKYSTGLEAPSWVLSDGTLRLLALTLLAYLREPPSVVLIEEPENGIHPAAIETVMQSLTSIWESQVFCASHSPIVLSLLKKEQILCFSKDEEGAVSIVNGADHPRLQRWHGQLTLGDLFAAGILS